MATRSYEFERGGPLGMRAYMHVQQMRLDLRMWIERLGAWSVQCTQYLGVVTCYHQWLLICSCSTFAAMQGLLHIGSRVTN